MKHLFRAVLLLGIVSCHTRAIFQSSRPLQPPAAPTDSVMTLKLTDNEIPDSAFFLGTVDCRYAPGTIKKGFDSLGRYARAEARIHGGNVLKLTKADIRSMHMQMKWDLYYLPLQPYASYCEARDSAARAYRASLRGHAIIHLINRGSWNPSSIYLRDSLLATLKGVGRRGMRTPEKATLRFDHPGRLVFSDDAGYLDFVTGKEYYVILYSTGGLRYIPIRYHHSLTDGDGFKNEFLVGFYSP